MTAPSHSFYVYLSGVTVHNRTLCNFYFISSMTLCARVVMHPRGRYSRECRGRRCTTCCLRYARSKPRRNAKPTASVACLGGPITTRLCATARALLAQSNPRTVAVSAHRIQCHTVLIPSEYAHDPDWALLSAYCLSRLVSHAPSQHLRPDNFRSVQKLMDTSPKLRAVRPQGMRHAGVSAQSWLRARVVTNS